MGIEGGGKLGRWISSAVSGGPSSVFLGYLAVFAVLGARWLHAATHAIPINTIYARGDTRLLTWILWWVASSITHHPSGILDAPINYPAPGQLTGSEHFVALQLLFLPVYEVTGNAILAINVLLFLAYPFAALMMNRLLVALGFSPLVAWVVGLAYSLGTLQAPAYIHQLHTLAFFPPALALTLHRLRSSPTVSASLVFSLVFLLGCFTAYYTAAILLVLVLVFGAAELWRPVAERRKFVLIVAAVATVCLALLAVASIPYVTRARSLESVAEIDLKLQQVAAMVRVYLTAAPTDIFGGVSLLLGLAGCVGLADRRLRGVTILGLALVAISVFLIRGGALTLVSLLPPSPLADLMRVPLRFFRMFVRYAPIAGLGLALLAAVALQLACWRLTRGMALAVLALVAIAVVGERGRLLFFQQLETSPATTSEAGVYDQIAGITAAEGRGPLLELPLSSFGYSLQPEAMMGSIRHHLPLVSGHTGYLPPHRHLIDQAAARLPSPAALQELIDMTHLRWILLRPTRYWGSETERESFARSLTEIEGVGPARSVEGWTLIAVRREPGRREWFDAIASGRGGEGIVLADHD